MKTGVITKSLEKSGQGAETPTWLIWYQCGRDIYARVGAEEDALNDVKIGTMTSKKIAEEVVSAHNQVLQQVQADK